MVERFLTYLSPLLIALVVIYVHRIIFFFRGLNKLIPGKSFAVQTVTVIVPARNEEKNIERCLNSLLHQNYPEEKLSFIIINDHSSDRTAEIVKTIAQHSAIPILLIESSAHADIKSPKLRALAHGIQHASGSIILTTDADCTAPPDWVASIVSHFEEGVGIVTGLTIFKRIESMSRIFWGIQFLDFLSYNSIAAGAIGWNRMLVSNGSNMAFRRDAFDDSVGFETLKHINTGDDSLLAQNITKDGKWIARFAFSTSSTITTQPASTIREMFHQRLRWVGQTAYYPPYMMFFMISTFIMFAMLAVTIPLTFVHWNAIPWVVLLIIFAVDYVTMQRFTQLTNTQEAMRYFIPTAIIHIPMILIATVGGYFFSFEWKGRTMKKESAA